MWLRPEKSTQEMKLEPKSPITTKKPTSANKGSSSAFIHPSPKPKTMSCFKVKSPGKVSKKKCKTAAKMVKISHFGDVDGFEKEAEKSLSSKWLSWKKSKG